MDIPVLWYIVGILVIALGGGGGWAWWWWKGETLELDVDGTTVALPASRGRIQTVYRGLLLYGTRWYLAVLKGGSVQRYLNTTAVRHPHTQTLVRRAIRWAVWTVPAVIVFALILFVGITPLIGLPLLGGAGVVSFVIWRVYGRFAGRYGTLLVLRWNPARIMAGVEITAFKDLWGRQQAKGGYAACSLDYGDWEPLPLRQDELAAALEESGLILGWTSPSGLNRVVSMNAEREEQKLALTEGAKDDNPLALWARLLVAALIIAVVAYACTTGQSGPVESVGGTLG